MRSLEPPEGSSRRGLWLVVLLVAAAFGAATWYLASREASPPPASATTARSSVPEPAESPTTANAPKASTERTAPPRSTSRETPDRPSRGSATAPKAAAATAVKELRVTSDVPGAYVFVDRKFLGTTPLVSRDVAPGTHQLNVQVEGRPPLVRTIDVLTDAPTVVDVTLPAAAATAPAAAVDASVAVVHQHGVGSCEGTLRATAEGLRYDTPHKDAFAVPLAEVQTFALEVQEKRLRVKQRGGRTWNFTTRDATAAALATFHHQVDAARR